MTVLELPTPDPRSFDETSRPFAEAVAARYAIRKLIGRGGMGIVYLARDRRLDRLVAIKTLPPHLAMDETVRERFLRETRTAGGMSHPNIVPIHGADEIDGHVFFVMGFVDGDSLAAHVRAEGQLAPRDVARMLRDVTSALVHAHGRGIIHRDIKAENILIERASGRALVTDFGIARLAEAAPLTATGQMLGTVYYISPEQVSGEKIDARSDLYSLGVVGFFALAGRFPFDSELASAVLIAHVNKSAPPLRSINPAVPASLASIVDRCLAKDPAHRYDGAAELLTALDAAIAEMDRPVVPARIEKPKLISDTEAQSVWNRAAELQAATGVHERPAPVPAPRDESRDRARTSGFKVDDVRLAAREAGISTQYIDHALVERGLRRPAPRTPAPPARPTPGAWLLGAPLDVARDVEIEGELQPRYFDRILNILHVGTGSVGRTSAKTRELAWRCSGPTRQLEVSVVPDEGRTTVRIAQNVRRLAAAAYGAAFAIGGAIVGPATIMVSYDVMRATRTPEFLRRIGVDLYMSRSDIEEVAVGLGLAAAAAVAIPLSRAFFRFLHRRSVAELEALADDVAEGARAGINAGRRDPSGL